MNNTDGYSKIVISCVFLILIFLITGYLNLSVNVRNDAVQAVMLSGETGVMNKYRILPCDTLLLNDSTLNIDIPEFLIEPEPIPEPEPEIEVPADIPPEIVYIGRVPYDYSVPVPETEPVTDDYFADALFIGDSRIVGLGNYSGVESYFYAKVSLTIRGVLTTAFVEDNNSDEVVTRTIMDTVTTYPQFKKVYIAFGLNELGWDPNVFINTYEYVIDQLQKLLPTASIYIQEIIPVTQKVSAAGKNHVRNETIYNFNALLLELAKKKQVFYLGVSEVFVDETGCIPDDAAWDGIHLNIDSCKKQMDYIRSHTVDYETVYLRPDENPVTELIVPEE